MTEQQNTRPSASREEIAMAIGFASRHELDASKDAAEFWEYTTSEGREWFLRMADAVLEIQTAPTEHPTEQPSVRDATEIDLSGSVLLEYQVQRGDAGLFHLYGSDGVFVSRKSIQECLEALPVLRKEMQAALRSLAQEGE